MKFKMLITLVTLVFSLNCFATRGYVGMNSINEIRLVDSSSACGPEAGACLILYFEGGAVGCTPSSNYLAFRSSHPDYKSIEAMAYMSLSTKKKFRTYATKESCADADLLNANGASIYDVAH